MSGSLKPTMTLHTNKVTESDYFSVLIARLPETEC